VAATPFSFLPFFINKFKPIFFFFSIEGIFFF
jgi:hypothetical protein